MKKSVSFLLAACLALAACEDRSDTAAQGAAPPSSSETSPAERRAGDAMDAIEDAGRDAGTSIREAAEDLRDASGPALERAREQGAAALDAATQGLNDLTRNAACQTARAADDADGIAANCRPQASSKLYYGPRRTKRFEGHDDLHTDRRQDDLMRQFAAYSRGDSSRRFSYR